MALLTTYPARGAAGVRVTAALKVSLGVSMVVLLAHLLPVEAQMRIPMTDQNFKNYCTKKKCKACYGDSCQVDLGFMGKQELSINGVIAGGLGSYDDNMAKCVPTTCDPNGCKKNLLGQVSITDLTNTKVLFSAFAFNCKCEPGPPPCFPASSTVRRLTPDNTLETVTMPQLRIGDTVECLVRDPVIDQSGRVTSSDVASSRLSRCQVYDYKKAMTNITAEYVTITYKRPGSGAQPGSVTMTANHHILDAKSGQAVMAGSLKSGDEVMMVTDKISARAKVLRVTRVQAKGAYVPLLTDGGLLVVDGVVAYPSSGDCDNGLDAKHWGQYYLSAPVWQSLKKTNGMTGKTLFELGSQSEKGIGAFTQKFYAIGKAAKEAGREVADWSGVAAEMHRAITQFGKVYTEEEALEVYNRHLYTPVA